MEAQNVGSATVLVTGQPVSLSCRSHSGKPREPSLTPVPLSCPSAFCLTFPTPFPPMTLL